MREVNSKLVRMSLFKNIMNVVSQNLAFYLLQFGNIQLFERLPNDGSQGANARLWLMEWIDWWLTTIPISDWNIIFWVSFPWMGIVMNRLRLLTPRSQHSFLFNTTEKRGIKSGIKTRVNPATRSTGSRWMCPWACEVRRLSRMDRCYKIRDEMEDWESIFCRETNIRWIGYRLFAWRNDAWGDDEVQLLQHAGLDGCIGVNPILFS